MTFTKAGQVSPTCYARRSSFSIDTSGQQPKKNMFEARSGQAFGAVESEPVELMLLAESSRSRLTANGQYRTFNLVVRSVHQSDQLA
ncbi:hypothetical protein BBG20_25180 [Pseudomonas aylmerensis]|uniref:Uncharacterized protein n=1 Tax=Pseudomonas aylmerensis TaxID=1869229 RepID=A0ABX2YWM1_9PSED|nr:hypothetical protein BBG20_25180 [Pseudomonas aylmerensis]